jgi:hypothetical protein
MTVGGIVAERLATAGVEHLLTQPAQDCRQRLLAVRMSLARANMCTWDWAAALGVSAGVAIYLAWRMSRRFAG